jgi:type I restriction enzyme S subunit
MKSSYLKGRIGWQGLKASEFVPDGPYLITGTDFENGRVEWDRCYHVSQERYDEATPIHIKNGDILITKDGTIGKVAYVQDCPEQAVLNSGIFLLRCADGSYDNRFMYHVLLSPLFEAFLRENLAGSTIDHLYQNVFERFEFPLPSHNEQRAITRILDGANDAILWSRLLVAKLRAIEDGMLQDLLRNGIDEHGRIRDSTAHPDQFKDSILGLTPIGTNVTTISGLASYVGSGITPRGGSRVYRAEGVLFLRSQNVTLDGLALDDVAYIDERTHHMMSRSEVHANDVLLNITGASIGRSCPVPENLGPANVNQHVCIIRLTSPRVEDAVLLSSVLQSDFGQRQIDRLNAGSNRQGLNYQQLRSISVPWPASSGERARIAGTVLALDSQIRTEEISLAKLQKIRTGLVHDLLTGSVPVGPLVEASA